METKFYRYRQNNSGGSFYTDKDLDVEVYVEAENAAEANALAQNKGIYFNGCESGQDCKCCGDRWCEVGDDDGYTAKEMSETVRSDLSGYHYKFSQVACIIHTLEGIRYTLYNDGDVAVYDSKNCQKVETGRIENFLPYFI